MGNWGGHTSPRTHFLLHTLLYSEDSPATKREGEVMGEEKKKKQRRAFLKVQGLRLCFHYSGYKFSPQVGKFHVQCARGWGNRREEREGKEGRKGKGRSNWKGGRLPSSGLWEQGGHTSQLPSSLGNQAQSKQTNTLAL